MFIFQMMMFIVKLCIVFESLTVFRLFQIYTSIQMQSQFCSKNETYEAMTSSYNFVKKKKEEKKKKEKLNNKNDFVMFESFEAFL